MHVVITGKTFCQAREGTWHPNVRRRHLKMTLCAFSTDPFMLALNGRLYVALTPSNDRVCFVKAAVNCVPTSEWMTGYLRVTLVGNDFCKK